MIIDTFGALRDRDNIKMSDVKGKCFICGLGVDAFERAASTSFEDHVRNHHYMWHYVSFLAHLGEKEVEDYDGVEQYVYQMSISKDVDWIP